MRFSTGVELRPDLPILDDDDRQLLAVLQPDWVKIRFANVEYILAILEICPNTKIIIRNHNEGYTLADLLEGYYRAAVLWQDERIAAALIGYAVANEPNWRDGEGHGPWVANAAGWGEALASFFREIGVPAIPLISPGLQRFGDIPAWLDVLNAFRHFWAYRGIHVYWNQPGMLPALEAAGEALDQVPNDQIGIVLEFNSSGYGPTEDRVGECQAVQRFFEIAGLAGSCLFIGRVPDSSEFRRFVYPAQQQRLILDARLPEEDIPMPPTFDVGPGMIAKMREMGDEPASDEIWTHFQKGNGEIVKYSIAYGRKGRYDYNPADGTVRFTATL